MKTIGAAIQCKVRGQKPRAMPRKRLIEAVEKDFNKTREL